MTMNGWVRRKEGELHTYLYWHARRFVEDKNVRILVVLNYK
jgi:hypothetical protein